MSAEMGRFDVIAPDLVGPVKFKCANFVCSTETGYDCFVRQICSLTPGDIPVASIRAEPRL
jgi:hypothetical protein